MLRPLSRKPREPVKVDTLLLPTGPGLYLEWPRPAVLVVRILDFPVESMKNTFNRENFASLLIFYRRNINYGGGYARSILCESEGKAARARLPIKRTILVPSFYLQVLNGNSSCSRGPANFAEKSFNAKKTPVRCSVLLSVTSFLYHYGATLTPCAPSGDWSEVRSRIDISRSLREPPYLILLRATYESLFITVQVHTIN